MSGTPEIVPYLRLDVGAFAAAVRPGLLFRSAWGVEPGLPGAVGDPRHKIDLRGRRWITPEELAVDHSRIAVIPVEQERHHPIHDDSTAADYLANYRGMLEHCAAELGAVVVEVARQVELGGCVLGCSIGRDRTGVVIALVMRGLGVPATDVLAAEVAMREAAARWVGASELPFEGMTRDQVVGRLLAPHEPVVDAVAELEARYGSVRSYLAGAGVDDPTWSSLAGSLLAPSSVTPGDR